MKLNYRDIERVHRKRPSLVKKDLDVTGRVLRAQRLGVAAPENYSHGACDLLIKFTLMNCGSGN